MSSQIPKAEVITRDAEGLVSTAVAQERALLAHLHMEVPKGSPSLVPHDSAVEEDDHSSLEELAGLCDAAGALVVGEITQKRTKQDPATLFGKGKVEEIETICRAEEVDVLVVDCDLTPAQGRNLENALDVRVIDRTELILDIFARRAQTRQAKLQVELAQLRYQLPRLKRMWTHLERIGGGIGLRGPGETQLETDRRLAGERIALLEKQLDEIRRQKKTETDGRREFETAALVGYTNVGKSALLNALSAPTGKGVLVANQLFATLGAFTRRLELGGGRAVLLSDTVGFVRRLPHNLVECFHSTLAEVEGAQFLLRVADAKDPELDDKMRAVDSVLGELHVADTPSILVLNQCDRLSPEERQTLAHRHPEAVFTSALTGEGLEELRERIRQTLEDSDDEVRWTLSSEDERTGKILAEISRHGRVLSEEWVTPDGSTSPVLKLHARVAPQWRIRLERELPNFTR